MKNKKLAINNHSHLKTTGLYVLLMEEFKVRSKKLLSLFVVGVLLTSMPAFAQKSVPTFEEENSRWSLNYEGEVEFDDQNQWKNTLDITYAFTDRMEVTFGGDFLKEEGRSLEYEVSKIEMAYQLTDAQYWFQSALEAGYEMNHLGDADKVEVKAVLEKSLGLWDHEFEASFEHEVGDKKQSGVGAGIELKTSYNFERYALGGEYHADFGLLKDHNDYGEQEHHIGPTVNFTIPMAGYEVDTTLGYFAGISSAAVDNIVKYEFGIAF